MGGCRCTFRGCPNNTANSPGMHFFHYPLKNAERYHLWLKYADTEQFLHIPKSQARNKVVCETHFRDECFMNYKKERLVQFAIPTLVRLPNGMVLDFEESDCPKPKLLEPTKSKHLIRPDPVNSSSSSDNRLTSNSEEEFLIETIEDIPTPSLPSQKRTYSVLEKADASSPKSKLMKPTKTPKILNSSLPYYSASISSKAQKEESVVHTVTRFPVEFSRSEEVFCDELTIESIEEHVEDLDEPESVKNEVAMEAQCEVQVDDVVQENTVEKTDSVSKAILDEIVADYEGTIKKLQEKIDQQEAAEKVKTTQVETVSTSRPPVSNTCGSMTKAQLFNAIKKYLSPSMAALVRMEMFGGPERQWKPDEKQVSMELLKLGETVFNYFQDEWRFRLPSKKDVQHWLSTCDNIEEEEEL